MKIADLDCFEPINSRIQPHQIRGGAYAATSTETYAASSPGAAISAASIDAIAAGDNTLTLSKMELRSVVKPSFSSSYARADATAIATSEAGTAIASSRSRSRSITIR